MHKLIYSILISLVVVTAQSQPIKTDFSDWDLSEAETTEVTLDGQKGLSVKGAIFLMEPAFENGVFEVDINFSAERFFPAIEFRVQADQQNYEHFYVRPHQSGNPDANQYSPVFFGTSAWQLYHGPEFAKPIQYEFDTWHHLKFDVRGDAVKIYFDDMETPILYTRLMGNFGAGGFGLSASRDDVAFANFQYEKRDETSFEDPLPAARELPTNLIESWEVSNVVHDSLFVGSTIDVQSKGLTWTEQGIEYTGSVNVSKGRARSQGNNTVVIRKTINSSTDQIKAVDFGFSDEVTVYLNGKAIFSGNNVFRTRDYRYLGTIGYFDTVHLDLKRGDNELLFVLKENFGGWGLQARFRDMDSIDI